MLAEGPRSVKRVRQREADMADRKALLAEVKKTEDEAKQKRDDAARSKAALVAAFESAKKVFEGIFADVIRECGGSVKLSIDDRKSTGSVNGTPGGPQRHRQVCNLITLVFSGAKGSYVVSALEHNGGTGVNHVPSNVLLCYGTKQHAFEFYREWAVPEGASDMGSIASSAREAVDHAVDEILRMLA
jgi:hypothetical protein